MLAETLHKAFLQSGKTLALAESCTGGSVSAALTAIPGASKFFLGSIVAYANTWKEQFLGVSSPTLKIKGAVSLETAKEMAEGLFAKTSCDYAAAITGTAGPLNGALFIAVGKRGHIEVKQFALPEGRTAAIAFAKEKTLQALLHCLQGKS